MAGKFGLLGRTLGHSWSPQIHALLGDYEYRLYEVGPDDLGRFLDTTDLDGMNVTIPYKRDVLPYCASVSDAARRIGSVNTLVRTPDGWYGENTDYAGFIDMAMACGVPLGGRKALVFGTGGASLAVCAALDALGAEPIVRISRTGADNYENLARHADAEILVNTTPLGMYPHTGISPVSLAVFPRCAAALDIVYNPARTAFLLDAEARGIPHIGGLTMLVSQARRSAELFTGGAIPDDRVNKIVHTLSRQTLNIVLIGMPGCGKTTVGRALAEGLDRPFIDADAAVADRAGLTIPEIFAREGESGFRARETEVLAELGRGSGAVIATGGGCVTRAENYPLIHQNGVIVWIERDLTCLASDGRPLSQINSAETLYAQRRDRYAAFADLVVHSDEIVEHTVSKILEAL